ncbi:hypothetical protein, partial [Candidatus Harpocratesius sp.]
GFSDYGTESRAAAAVLRDLLGNIISAVSKRRRFSTHAKRPLRRRREILSIKIKQIDNKCVDIVYTRYYL